MAAESRKRTGITGHDLLLRMAGRIPDLDLAQARRTLAEGKVAEAIAPIADLLTATPVLLTAQEIAAIRDLSGKADALPGAKPVADPVPASFAFSPLDEFGETNRDEIDEALIAAAEAYAGSVPAIWRTWRHIVRDGQDEDQAAGGGHRAMRVTLLSSEPEPVRLHRVYIVQVKDRATIDEVAPDLLSAVPDEANAGIEIIVLDAEPPPYQRAALSASGLLWTAQAEPEFTVARVFDFADPVTGPSFKPDHRVIDDPATRESLLTYLSNGHPVLMTTATMEDVIDPAAGAVVPSSFRTDGEFIWTDTVHYYLDRHRLAPDARLTEHIEARIAHGQLVPHTDNETALRAADYLLHPPPAEARTAVWFPGRR